MQNLIIESLISFAPFWVTMSLIMSIHQILTSKDLVPDVRGFMYVSLVLMTFVMYLFAWWFFAGAYLYNLRTRN